MLISNLIFIFLFFCKKFGSFRSNQNQIKINQIKSKNSGVVRRDKIELIRLGAIRFAIRFSQISNILFTISLFGLQIDLNKYK
jgi:hypothetical protein